MFLIHLFTFKIIQSYDTIFYDKISSTVTLSVRATTQNSKNRSEAKFIPHFSQQLPFLCVLVSGLYKKMMMVTMEISTFPKQMEKITDAIGTDTSIITQSSNDHLTTTSSSNY